jgi:phosphatidylserine/phosphatidylglycerophosphate/cardiolipin synthase-like enzyme
MTMYELSDPSVTSLLDQAAGRGLAVRVILDQNNEQDANAAAYQDLAASGVQVHWANPAYACTHQKTITVDGATSAVMSLNLTPRYYATSRDFAVVTTDPGDVAAIEATFDADFEDATNVPQAGDHLLWSPTNAQAGLLGLIKGATATLGVENEEMSDAVIVAALCDAAARGVAVQVAMTDRGSYHRQLDQLRNAGVALALYPPSAPLYIHAKVILADFGTPGARAFIGSENFSVASLTRNRELGLVLADPALLASLNATLASDFAGGQ